MKQTEGIGLLGFAIRISSGLCISILVPMILGREWASPSQVDSSLPIVHKLLGLLTLILISSIYLTTGILARFWTTRIHTLLLILSLIGFVAVAKTPGIGMLAFSMFAATGTFTALIIWRYKKSAVGKILRLRQAI